MKKIYLFAFILGCLVLFAYHNAPAQGIYQHWCTTPFGGTDEDGLVFTTKYDGTGYRKMEGVGSIKPGYNPNNNFPLVFNNKIYFCLSSGGLNDKGCMIRYDPSNGDYDKVADFYAIGAEVPVGNLVVHNNKIYGVTEWDSTGSNGVLYEFDPATLTLTNKYVFDPATGRNPRNGLISYDGKLYGTTFLGGFYGGGVIYQFDPGTEVYTVKKHFAEVNGWKSFVTLTLYNNKFYGVTLSGGANNEGVVYEFNPASNAYVVKHTIAGATDGKECFSSMVVYNDKLYGQMSDSGANDNGTLFEYDPVGNIYTTKVHYTQAQGDAGSARLAIYNGKLYGVTESGNVNYTGTLFEYNPANNSFALKANFFTSIGMMPTEGLCLYNNKLYGLTTAGGKTREGTLYEYNPGPNGITVKAHIRDNRGLQPIGPVTYYNGKVYGMTLRGGDSTWGVIYQYDLETKAYEVLHPFNQDEGFPYNEGDLTLYGGKLYGVTMMGGPNAGVLFQYDIANDIYTVLHTFTFAGTDGAGPTGKVVIYNNKIYGTCEFSGLSPTSEGIIYEYDLGTSAYAVKVELTPAFGTRPVGGLMLYNSKMYGVTSFEGAHGRGTLFEYNPNGNVYQVKFDFDSPDGIYPEGRLEVLNSKLYGMTKTAGANNSGTIFEYNPANGVFTTKYHLNAPQGQYPYGSLLADNGKLYGMTKYGGSQNIGTMFEYDPSGNTYTTTLDFNIVNGKNPIHTSPAKVPAMIAPGTPGSCTGGGIANVSALNSTEWIQFTNQYGDAIAEINADGNNLGSIAVDYYVHNGSTRTDLNGDPYLDRNITISVQNQLATPVYVRLYITKAEFESYKNTPGSGVVSIGQMSLFKNNDGCVSAIGNPATQIPCSVQPWGGGYVFITQVSSFSSFYFAATSNTVLPIHLLSFAGKALEQSNQLEWKVSCDEPISFGIEKSLDGQKFSEIGKMEASVADCAAPFYFDDLQISGGKSYYRLKLTQQNGSFSYSPIVTINREKLSSGWSVQLAPNPVVGNEAQLQTSSAESREVSVAIIDLSGRRVYSNTYTVPSGTNTLKLDLSSLSAGLYEMSVQSGNEKKHIRMVKQ